MRLAGPAQLPAGQDISPAELQRMLEDGDVLALLDPREEGRFSTSPHLFHAVNLPLSRLEFRIAALIPWADILVVVAGGDEEGLDRRMAERLRHLGYGRVRVLGGGVRGWVEAGLPAFTGFNVPSKAFGEFVEHEFGTPSIGPDELARLKDKGADLIVLDSRTPAEHRRGTIPGSVSTPGAELVFRARAMAPSPATTIVVNCAGRTRSILGAQSLISAGMPNPVVALRNGTMGWRLAGFQVEAGAERRADDPSPAAAAEAREAAWRLAARAGVRATHWAEVEAWRTDPRRPCFLFDVRHEEEFLRGTAPGAGHAPGGQLIQATDSYLAVRGARLVLFDPQEVRALMTASWLRQMGHEDVLVLAEAPDGQGAAAPDLGLPLAQPPHVTAQEVAALGQDALLVELGPSRVFVEGHVPGALWTPRSRLAAALATQDGSRTLVLSAPEEGLARLTWAEASACWPGPVRVLLGGTGAWREAGLPMEVGEAGLVGPVDDAFIRPFEARGDVEKSMRDYLDWEVGLLDRLRSDRTVRFRRLV